MNPLGNRARAEELARLLEGAVASSSASTAGLAALAARMRSLTPVLDGTVALQPDFRAALRQRLVAVATVQGAVADVPGADEHAGASAFERALSWSRSWTAQKRLAAVSGAMAAVVALTGVGVASSRSLPGQPFYGIKRASEALQLELAGSDTAKGTKHLEFAATRLREVQALVRGDHELAAGTPGTPLSAGLAASLQERVNDTLKDFNSETSEGRTLLEGVYRRTGKTAPLRVLATFATQQKHKLTGLLPDLPDGSAVAAQQSLQLVEGLGKTATDLLAVGTCQASCNPDASGPTLPVEPAPKPGTSATPGADDNNGVPPCACGQPTTAPEPSAEPSDSPTPEPTESATATPSPSPSPTKSPDGGILPPLPIPLPTILPTSLPTLIPLPIPPLPLPTDLPTILPTLGVDIALKP
jgi:hypothetical protein